MSSRASLQNMPSMPPPSSAWRTVLGSLHVVRVPGSFRTHRTYAAVPGSRFHIGVAVFSRLSQCPHSPNAPSPTSTGSHISDRVRAAPQACRGSARRWPVATACSSRERGRNARGGSGWSRVRGLGEGGSSWRWGGRRKTARRACSTAGLRPVPSVCCVVLFETVFDTHAHNRTERVV